MQPVSLAPRALSKQSSYWRPAFVSLHRISRSKKDTHIIYIFVSYGIVVLLGSFGMACIEPVGTVMFQEILLYCSCPEPDSNALQIP